MRGTACPHPSQTGLTRKPRLKIGMTHAQMALTMMFSNTLPADHASFTPAGTRSSGRVAPPSGGESVLRFRHARAFAADLSSRLEAVMGGRRRVMSPLG